jgi:hypothetical protein
VVAPKTNNIGCFTRYLKIVLIFLKPAYDGINHLGFSQWFFDVPSLRVAQHSGGEIDNMTN